MRTVFITCIRGIISRNILSTEAFAALRRVPDLRLVIVASESRAPVLLREFGGPNVSVERIAARPPAGLAKLVWVVATNLLASSTRSIQRRTKLARDRNIFDYVASLFFSLLGRVRIVRRIFRAIAAQLDPGREFDTLFAHYRPALVFSTDVYDLADVRILRAAKRYGVRTVGMVRSWDNVTSKTLLSVIPDRLVVNTRRIGDEAVRYGDMPPERIVSVGVPHYDRYRPEYCTPRNDFFRKLGLDPAKRLTLFTPPSDRYLRGDPVTPIILKAMDGLGTQVLVRMPLVGRSELAGYRPQTGAPRQSGEALASRPPGVVFDEPGGPGDFVDVHMTPEADRHLADSILHSDVVITWASTMIIDAAAFDKPIVLVGFDASPRPLSRSIRQYYRYDHHRAILASGGVRLVESPEELAEVVRGYLEYPERDRESREWIRREYAGELDGKAGERLAACLLGILDQDRA